LVVSNQVNDYISPPFGEFETNIRESHSASERQHLIHNMPGKAACKGLLLLLDHQQQRGIGQRRRVLGDVGQHPSIRPFQVAAIGVQLAAQQPEEGGFAATVGAGEADLPARMQLQ